MHPVFTRALIVIPVYNNARSLRSVAEHALSTGLPVLVVNDGSTDGGPETLAGLDLERVDLPANRGKGAAILAGAEWAEGRGFSHLVTVDGDGQHDAAEALVLVERAKAKPWAIVVGRRGFAAAEAPRSSRFGRVWSNFWLRIASGASLPDSQSGFRAYPVAALRRLALSARHYDFEVEVLVKSVWAGLVLDWVPVSVQYPKGAERVSHFDPWLDNARISVAYTRLVARAFLPVAHRRLFHPPDAADRISLRRPVHALKILLRERTTPREIALACMLGVYLACLPVFGLHSALILFFATGLKLNRLIALNSQHLCMPPVVPGLCIEAGYYMRHGRFLTDFNFDTLGRQLPERMWEWLLGSFVVGPALALACGVLAYALAVVCRAQIRRVRARRRARGEAPGLA